jgi:DNA-binding NtrC family response regulator
MMENKQILIIDDQQNWRDALSDLLIQDGYGVDTADSVESGMQALGQKEYSLVITDIRLVDEQPGDASGLKLLSRMLQEWAFTNRPSIVVMTGFLVAGIEDLALSKYKADFFFAKNPSDGFNVAIFRDQINKLLTNS